MSKEKQIEGLVEAIRIGRHAMCDICLPTGRDCDLCETERLVNAIYNAGYRKQSVGEWKEHVRVSKEGKPLLRHYQCNLCGVYLATQANFCPNCGAKMKGEPHEK